MAFDRQAGGHNFDFSREKCTKCGMTREYFEDNFEPRCKGTPADADEVKHEPKVVEEQ